MPDSLDEMPPAPLAKATTRAAAAAMAEAESSPAVAVASEASLESAPTTSRAREHFANRDADWFDEGDYDDDDYPPPSSVPFIHIPKTGGTSIEDTFHSRGIKAGRFAFDEDDKFLPYSTMSVPCSKWHEPPRSYVNGSFCVLRDPYTRMVSEFNYQKIWYEKRQMGASHTNCTCSDFDKWIHQMYTELKTNPWAHDCHFVPQTTYTSKCDNILIYQQDVNTFLWAYYDITKNQRTVSNASPHCLHDHEEDDLCKTTKKFILEEWYRSDHELFLNMTN